MKIKSEHVARVTDVGELENGSPYMVMEYLDGSDLAVLLEQRGTLPIEQAVDFVLQTCEALADAHSLGIVHRDLKPANLFCIERSDGQLSIKVLDFGISKIMTPGAPGHDAKRTTAVMGSPPYMSPEQMETGERGGRAGGHLVPRDHLVSARDRTPPLRRRSGDGAGLSKSPMSPPPKFLTLLPEAPSGLSR